MRIDRPHRILIARAAIIAADSYSRKYEQARNPDYQYEDEASSLQSQIESQKSTSQKAIDWAQKNRYSIVFGSWVASMGAALGIVGRNPYLSGQQKLVQARVYAQGLTMAVVIASLALEGNDAGQGKGRWEKVKILDPNDPDHKRVIEKEVHHERYAGEDQWRDMVAAEEERIKAREQAVEEAEKADKKKGKKVKHHSSVEEMERGKPEEAKDKKVNAP